MKKVILGIILLVIVASGLLYFLISGTKEQKKAAEPTPTKALEYKVRLGIIKNGFIEPLPAIARKKGFFKKYGVDVTIQKIDKGISTALVGKQVDAAFDTPATFITSKANGEADIFEVGELSSDSPAVFLSYKPPQEIKVVGISRLGGDHHFRALDALKILKINPKTIKFQVIGTSDNALLALMEKKIDATSMTTQRWNLFQLRNKPSDEFKVLVDSSKFKEIRNPQIIVFDAGFINDNQKSAEAFTKAIIEANKWIIDSKAEDVAKVMEGENQLTYDEALIFAKVYKDSLGDWKFRPDIEKLSEITKSIEKDIKNKDFDIKTFVSDKIYNSLEKSGFFKEIGF